MQNKMTRKLVLCALFIALVFIITYLVKFPIGIGGAYINAGDAFIYTAGVAMSGPWAALAAGVGSMLADLLVGSGAAIYAPGTLVIKAAMGLIVGLALYGRKASVLRYIVFMVISSLVMVIGYGIYEFILFKEFAKINFYFNLIQAAGGVVLGVPLALLVRRILPQAWLEAFRKPEK